MRVMLGCLAIVCAACDGTSGTDAGRTQDAGRDDAGSAVCALLEDTSATGVESPSGCAVLDRDTTECAADRAGLDGFWLDFSCRVALTSTGSTIHAVSDGLPDHRSNYFHETDACWEEYTDAIQNPNFIAEQGYTIDFPSAPTTQVTEMRGAVVGLAANGVAIFGNFAAPGDDIFQEAMTFDRCGAHPQMTGVYHYHSEPNALSYDDDRFIGVMRDGYPIYGRRDTDGSIPTLDAQGGHTGVTPHSATPVYHYHLNEQTSTTGETQWFLTTGNYHGAPGACAGC